MSSVQTGQMSAVETGQTSAAETGQMSAVETGQMSAAETGHLSCLIRHLFRGGPGGLSLQPVDQIAIFGTHPAQTGGDRRRPAETGGDRGSTRIWCQAPPSGPSPSMRKGQDDGS